MADTAPPPWEMDWSGAGAAPVPAAPKPWEMAWGQPAAPAPAPAAPPLRKTLAPDISGVDPSGRVALRDPGEPAIDPVQDTNPAVSSDDLVGTFGPYPAPVAAAGLFGRGVAEGVAAIPRGAGALIGDNPVGSTLSRIGQRLQQSAEDTFPVPKEQQSTLGGEVARGVGGTAGMVAGAALTGGASLAGGLVAGGAIAGTQGADALAQDAVAHGASPATRQKSAWEGLAVGTLSALPIANVLRPFGGLAGQTGSQLVRYLTGIAQQAGLQGGVGAAQQALNNEIARLNYDPARGATDGTWHAFIVNGLVGGLFGALHLPERPDPAGAAPAGDASTPPPGGAGAGPGTPPPGGGPAGGAGPSAGPDPFHAAPGSPSAPQGPDGRFATGSGGFVASDAGGPLAFPDQLSAAHWILRQGALSPDQIFEIANHPGASGYTVRETGRSAPPPEGMSSSSTSREGAKSDTPPPGPTPESVSPGASGRPGTLKDRIDSYDREREAGATHDEAYRTASGQAPPRRFAKGDQVVLPDGTQATIARVQRRPGAKGQEPEFGYHVRVPGKPGLSEWGGDDLRTPGDVADQRQAEEDARAEAELTESLKNVPVVDEDGNPVEVPPQAATAGAAGDNPENSRQTGPINLDIPPTAGPAPGPENITQNITEAGTVPPRDDQSGPARSPTRSETAQAPGASPEPGPTPATNAAILQTGMQSAVPDASSARPLKRDVETGPESEASSPASGGTGGGTSPGTGEAAPERKTADIVRLPTKPKPPEPEVRINPTLREALLDPEKERALYEAQRTPEERAIRQALREQGKRQPEKTAYRHPPIDVGDALAGTRLPVTKGEPAGVPANAAEPPAASGGEKAAETSTGGVAQVRNPASLPERPKDLHSALAAALERGPLSAADARKLAEEATGKKHSPGTMAAKELEEAIEQAGVSIARKIVEEHGGDRRATFRKLVRLEQRMPALQVRTSGSIERQAYSTPLPLAFVASRLAGIGKGTSVYEPTAGNGALLMEADPKAGVLANEIDPARAAFLKRLGFATKGEDATTLSAGRHFDVVIANPPFGTVKRGGELMRWPVKGPPGTGDKTLFETPDIDQAIAMRALGYMHAGRTHGRAVLILGGPHPMRVGKAESYRGGTKQKFFYALYDHYNVVDHVTVSGDLYGKQGAGWPVDLVVIHGRGKSERPLPAKQPPRVLTTWDEVGSLLDGVEPAREQPAAPAEAGAAGGGQPAVPEGERGAGAAEGPDGGGPEPVPGPSGGPPPVAGEPGGRPGRGGEGGGDEAGGRGVPGGPAERPGRAPRRGERDERVAAAAEPRPEPPAERERAGASPAPDHGPGDDARGLGEQPHPERPGQLEPEPESKPAPKPPKAKASAQPAEAPSEHQVAYKPRAKTAESVGTLMPVNMAKGADAAFKALEAKVGPVEVYVAKALGYKKADLPRYFSAEQVDALGLALHNLEQGKGFVIGDQTGVGKGRIVAAIIRHAKRSGLVPIFVTEKANLYSDMMRDLGDVGEEGFRPLATNSSLSGGDAIQLPDGRTLRTAADHREELAHAAAIGRLEDRQGNRYDGIFTTYSQLQTVAKSRTPRNRFVEAFLPRAVLILDESHNGGGAGAQEKPRGKNPGEPRSAILRQYVGRARGVFYSSATWAKRPDSMSLYSKTDIGKVGGDDIAKSFAKGGVPLQQVASSMLTEAGQYLRRERSFQGVEFRNEAYPVDRKAAENAARAMRAIVKFEEDFIKPIIAGMKEDSAGEGSAAGGDAGGVSSTNFTAIMHNVIDQFLLSLKAEQAAREAVAALKAGEKPVIAVANTMGSLIDEMVEEQGLKPGDRIAFDFRDAFLRYLERARWYSEGDPYGKKERKRITDAELGPAGVRAFKAAQGMIQGLDLGNAPGSPIDHIANRLREAGYRVGEITGRSATVDYSSPELGPVYRVRPQREKSKGAIVRQIGRFNGGDANAPLPEEDRLDAMILNQSGAAGLSLHASEKFGDRRKRRMIIAQAERNIDVFMQILGRVHRTGQVELPSYTLAAADIPAEKRPAAVLSRKLASLNANTTASTKGEVSVAGEELLDATGDEVAKAIVEGDDDLGEKLGWPKVSEEGKPAEGAMRRVTGRIPLLPVAEQEELYQKLEEAYREAVERKRAMGQNVGSAETLDLDARPIMRSALFEGGGDGPFGAPAHLTQMSVKRQGKPMRSAEVLDALRGPVGAAEGAKLPTLRAAHRELQERAWSDALKEWELYRDAKVGGIEDRVSREKQRIRLEGMRDRVAAITSRFAPGDVVKVLGDEENLYGVVLAIERAGKSANPIVPSGWRVRIAVADPVRLLNLPLSEVYASEAAPEKNDGATLLEHFEGKLPLEPGQPPKDIIDLFDEMQGGSREKRYMVTGNVLAGFGKVGNKGRIVFYTDHEGRTQPGVLLPKGYKADMLGEKRPQAVAADKVVDFLDRGGEVATPDGDLQLEREYPGSYRLVAHASKSRGGRYFLDRELIGAAGQEFVKTGKGMVVRGLPASAARRVAEMVAARFGGFHAFEGQRLARQVQGLPEPRVERFDEKGKPAAGEAPAFALRVGDQPASRGPGSLELHPDVRAEPLTPKARAERAEIMRRLRNIAAEMNPHADLSFFEALFGRGAGMEAHGMPGDAWHEGLGVTMPGRRLIAVALSGDDPEVLGTGLHELWHSIEPMLRPEDVKLLRDAYPGRRGETAEEEAAEAFGGWAADRERFRGRPEVGRLFGRIWRFLKRLGNMLRGMGFQTVEDVFGRARKGGYAPDRPGRGPEEPAFSAGERRASASGMLRERPVDDPVSDIADALRRDRESHPFDDYGLRVLPDESGHVEPGDRLRPSYRWENGDPTDELLDGTSAVGIGRGGRPDLAQALRDLGADDGPRSSYAFYQGERVALVRGEKRGDGQDPGEVVLADPEVVALWKKAGASGGPIIARLEPDETPRSTGHEERGEPPSFAVRRPRSPSSWQVPDRAAIAARNERWTTALRRFLTTSRQRVQDEFTHLDAYQRAIVEDARGGKALPDRLNPKQRAEIWEQRATARTRRFEEEQVRPYLSVLTKNGITLEDVGRYLVARHAPYYNAAKADQGAEHPEFAAGIDDATARERQREYEDGPQGDVFKDIARRHDAITDQRLRDLVSYGLVSQDTADTLRAMYPHYVSLSGISEPDEIDEAIEAGARPKTGRGFDVRGPEFKVGRGRGEGNEVPYEDVLPRTLSASEGTYVRGEKNRVGQAVLELATRYPNPEVWEVGRVEPSTSIKDGQLRTRKVPKRAPPEVLAVKRDGTAYYVTIRHPDLAAALHNMGGAGVVGVLQAARVMHNWLATVNTRASPDFIVTNLIRDMQDQGLNLQGTELQDRVGSIVADVPRALQGVALMLRGNTAHPWARWAREWEESGGRTGFVQIRTLDDQRARLQRLVDDATLPLGRKPRDAAEARRMAGKAWRKGPGVIAHAVEYLNDVTEGATRLAVYKNAREAGLSRDRAAYYASNATVNFNKRGAFGRQLSAIWLFANASIQSNANIMRAMSTRRGLAMAAGVVGAGFVMGLLNALLAGTGEDGENNYDRNASGWIRQHNLLIPLPHGSSLRYLMFPLAYGWNSLWAAGETAGRFAASKMGAGNKVDMASEVAGLASLAWNTWSPIGDSLVPTIFQPWLEWKTNRDFAGKPIVPDETMGQKKAGTPGSEVSWPNTPNAYVAASKGLSRATGGNGVEPGGVEIPPNVIQHFTEFLGGGALQTLERGYLLGQKAWQGKTDDLGWRDVPAVRRFLGGENPWYTQTQYARARDAVEAAEARSKVYRKAGDDQGADRLQDSPEGRVRPDFKAAQSRLADLYVQRRGAVRDGEDTRDLDARIADEKTTALRAYNDAARGAAAP